MKIDRYCFLSNYAKTFVINPISFFRVDTRILPFIYQVSDVMDEKAGGYYYGAELSRVPKMTPERILKRKLGKNGKRLGFAKFKDYDRYCNSYCFSQFLYIMISFFYCSSYNRWIVLD